MIGVKTPASNPCHDQHPAARTGRPRHDASRIVNCEVPCKITPHSIAIIAIAGADARVFKTDLTRHLQPLAISIRSLTFCCFKQLVLVRIIDKLYVPSIGSSTYPVKSGAHNCCRAPSSSSSESITTSGYARCNSVRKMSCDLISLTVTRSLALVFLMHHVLAFGVYSRLLFSRQFS